MDYSLIFYIFLLSSLTVHLSYRVKEEDVRLNMLFWFSLLFLGASVLSLGFLFFSPEGVSPSLRMIMSLLYGPFLLVAVTEYLDSEIRPGRLYFHFIPFFLLLLSYLLVLNQSRLLFWTKEGLSIAFHVFAFVSCFFYSIYSMYLLEQRKISGTPGSTLIRVVSLFILLYSVVVLVRMYLSFGEGRMGADETIPVYSLLCCSLVVTSVCLMGIRSALLLYAGTPFSKAREKGGYSIEISDDITKVVPMERLAENLILFEELMYHNKYFLNPDAGLDRIAEMLKIPSYQVTHLVNHVYQVGLPELINRMRIHHSCQLIREYPDKTLFFIANESGYSSETSFFRNFRAYTGVTPRQYQVHITTKQKS